MVFTESLITHDSMVGKWTENRTGRAAALPYQNQIIGRAAVLRRLNLASGQLLQLFGIPGTLHSKRRSQAGERRPQAGERRPQARERRPQARERRPQVGKRRPQTRERRPQARERRPQAGKPRPQARERRPQARERLPQAGKPRENEEFRPKRPKIVFRMLKP